MQEYKIERELTLGENRGYEIHDGKIYYMADASTGHSEVSGNILAIFKNFLKGKKCRVFNNEVNVMFKRNFRQYMPDVKIVCDQSKIKKDGIYGAPDLVVEVMSKSTEKNDRGYKFNVYEQSGVKEYWLVDLNSKNIEVYLLDDGKFALDNIYHHYSDEEIEEIEEYAIETDDVKAEKEQMKIKTMKTSVFGDELIIAIADVFENV